MPGSKVDYVFLASTKTLKILLHGSDAVQLNYYKVES